MSIDKINKVETKTPETPETPQTPQTPQIIKYKGKGFNVEVASNWKVQQADENRTFFYGPKVGKLRVGFYITSMPKKDKSYMEAAQIMKTSQSTEKNYTVLEEADISQDNFKAFMRRASWYNADKDMTLFIRNIFTETDEQVFMISSSIPNSPALAELDEALISMMNTFSFREPAIA